MATSSANDLHLVPLGAGDLIDRAVRLYRRHLFTLMRIAAPPVVVSAIGWVMWTIATRQIFTTPDTATLLFYVLLILVAFALVAGGHILSLIVMGGASRNLVTHLLWGEPVLARTTYAAVRSRFWSLLGATLLVVMWLGLATMVASSAGYFIGIFLVIAVVFLSQVAPVWVSVIVGIAGGVAALAVSLWLFFFMAGKVAYVPQVLLVEGKRVFESISRSFSLASGNIRRLMAMTLFTLFATYSALALLIIPLGFVGWINGIEISYFGSQWPTWYSIGYQVILQCSHILLAPIWMLGLSLLYVDERVRHEGYDIELMAARELPEMPNLPGVVSPFAPALVTGRAPKFVSPPPQPQPLHTGTVLGLN